jgi:hypothetical protein
VRSQRAIERIGGVRDTVYYGIIDVEWPAVKARLEARVLTS